MKAALARFIVSKPGGFLTSPADLQRLIQLERLCVVLVRLGNARFMAPAQDVEQLIRHCVAGGDYVRDISFPVAIYREARAEDGRNPAPTVSPRSFNENDCGGVFDGQQVTSDADPGM